MLKCPNCGAPLQGTGMAEQRACTYCGTLLQVPKPAPAMQAPRAAAQPHSSRAILLVSVLGLLSLALAAGVVTFRTVMSSMSAVAVPEGSPAGAEQAAQVAQVALPPTPPRVAWNRLEGIDIHATVDQAKVALKQQFPEAKVDQDKEYRIDLDHPILSDVLYSWDWGCTCLERAVFYFKDYPTRMKTTEAFIPCLERGLGAITTSAPPFDYDWPAHGDLPHVHLGPQILMIDLPRGTSEVSYRKVLGILGSCRN